MLETTLAAVLSILLAGTALAQAPAEVVFRNVRVFDGKSERLTAATSVLVRGNQIAAMGPAAVATAPGATVIEGAEARATLMRGFSVREQLMRGASQIKLTAGGGVTSPHSATDAGVKVIEHAHLVDEPRPNSSSTTARYRAEKGAWLSTQPFLADEPSPFPPGSDQFLKQQQVIAGTEVIYGFVRKYRIKTAFGTDISPTSGWSRTLSATSASS